jgi:hypothetical protein
MLRMVVALTLATWGFTAYGASVDIAVKEVKSGDWVENAVVSLHPVEGKAPLPENPPIQVMDQIDKEFVPHVLPVVLGTPVLFPNKDQIKHHVYSLDETNPFELKLYRGTPAKPMVFDVAGEVSLGCNIHDYMSGYIYVVDTPWYGMSKRDGQIHIAGIPAGEYELRVWQPRIRNIASYTKQIVLDEHQEYSDEFALKLRRLIKKERMPAEWFLNPY